MEQISYKREIFYSHSLTAKENLKKMIHSNFIVSTVPAMAPFTNMV